MKSSLAMALAFASSQALALGLGPIQVKSGLNQPLSAEIPVIADSPAEVNDLRVDLATSEDFQRVGLSRERVGIPIDFAVGSNGRGQTVIKLTTKTSVSEPFLDFLIEVNWGNGKLLREYTVLLDPPVAAPAVVTTSKPVMAAAAPAALPAPVVAAPPSKPAPVESAAPSIDTPRPSARVAAPPPPPPAPTASKAPASASRSPSAGQYGPVQKGETLSSIVRGLTANDGGNLNQLMLALLKANPDAFYRDNVNALKAGAVLRIPSAQEIDAAGSIKEAVAALRAQNQSWQQDSVKPTLIAQTGAPPDRSPETKPIASTKPAHLALVPPSSKGSEVTSDQPGSGTGTGKDGAEARAELARTKESLANREQETTDLKSQVKRLEEINDKGQRLLSLKDSEIADLQNKLKELQAAKGVTPVAVPAPATAPDTAAAKPPVVAAAPASTAPATTPDAMAAAKPPVPVVDAAKPTASTSTSPSPPPSTPPATTPPPSTTPASATPVAAPPVKPVATPAKSPATPVAADKAWYSDYLGGNPSTLLYAIGILFLLIGGWVLSRFLNKPKPVRTKFPGAAARLSTLEDQASQQPETLSADAQEQQLLDRLAQNPDDIGLSLELLRHYYVQGDASRFEALAETIHPHLQDDSLEWQEIAAMGESLLPHHALFSGNAAQQDLTDDASHTFAFEQDHKPTDFRLTESSGVASYSLGEDPKFDPLGLDRGAANAAVSSPTGEPLADVDQTTQRFEFKDLQAHAQEHAAAVPSASDALHGSEYPGYEPAIQNEIPAHDPVARDMAGFEFDGAHSELLQRGAAPQTDVAHESGLEELGLDDDLIGTRLDLARAYIDMGDAEGARSMLDEVIAEGNAAQKDEARKLLAEL